MRFLFWFLLLAIAAVVVALAVKLNAGYALLVAQPYRIELSLNLLLVLLVGGFFALYLVIRIITRTIQMPRTVRVWRRRQKLERARAKQDGAVVALLAGLNVVLINSDMSRLEQAGAFDMRGVGNLRCFVVSDLWRQRRHQHQ